MLRILRFSLNTDRPKSTFETARVRANSYHTAALAKGIEWSIKIASGCVRFMTV